MQAFVITEKKSPPILITDHPEPEVENEVVIDLNAAAFNRRDDWITKGLYPGIKPSVLGSDGCGVAQTGKFSGQDVLICPSINWGKDERAQGASYEILGMPRDGTFAEKISIKQSLLQPKPKHLSATEAAALPLAGLTAWRALMTRGEAKKGDKVLISGVGGGVALFAMQFAVALGCEVHVTSSKPEKIARAVKLGAANGVLYTETDWDKKLPAGFDVIIDSAGGEGFGALTERLGMGGRIVFYGATLGNWPVIRPHRHFFRQTSILGSTMGSPVEFKQMLSFVNQHQLKPVVDSVFPLSKAAEGLERLVSGERFGKVVLKIS